MCTWSPSPSRWLHLERTSAGALGVLPATKAKTNSNALGPPVAEIPASTARAVTLTSAATGTTRRCPFRSTSRPTCGVASAAVSA